MNLSELKIGMVLVKSDGIEGFYVVDHADSFGGPFTLVPIIRDESRAVFPVCSSVVEKLKLYK